MRVKLKVENGDKIEVLYMVFVSRDKKLVMDFLTELSYMVKRMEEKEGGED